MIIRIESCKRDSDIWEITLYGDNIRVEMPEILSQNTAQSW